MADNMYIDCANTAVAASNGALTKDDALRMVENLHRSAKSRAYLKQQTLVQALDDIAGVMSYNVTSKLAFAKRNRLLTLKKSRLAEEIMGKAASGPYKALLGMIEGVTNQDFASKSSIDAVHNAIRESTRAIFLDRLGDAETIKEFDSGKIDKEIYLEAYAIQNGAVPGATTKNARAGKIADAVHQTNRELSFQENLEGAWIEELKGYTVPQTTTPHYVQRGGRENKGRLSKDEAKAKFLAFVLPRIDKATYLAQGKDVHLFLDGFFESVYTGVYGTPMDELKMLDPGSPSGSLSRSASAHRQLTLKDATAEFEYAQKYGVGNMSTAFHDSLSSRAQRLAVMSKFGDNPEKMLDDLIRRWLEKGRSEKDASGAYVANQAQIDELEAKTMSLKKALGAATGKANTVASVGLSRTVSAISVFQRAVNLGSSMLASIPDLALLPLEALWQGSKHIDAYLDSFSAMVKGLSPAYRKSMFRELGVTLDLLHAHALSRFDHETGALSGLGRWTNKWMFRLNLQSWWNDVMRTSAATMASWRLADNAGKAYGDLHPRYQNLLKIYGIDAVRWDHIRSQPVQGIGGHNYLFADALPPVQDSVLLAAGLKLTAANRERYGRDSVRMLQTLLSDRLGHTILQPGSKQRRLLTGGAQPGTMTHATMTMLTMFKSYPLSFLQKRLAAEIQGRGYKAGERMKWAMESGGPAAVLQTIGLVTMLGYFSGVMKDWSRGKERRKFLKDDGSLNKPTIVDALAKGGGLGIFGDLMFREYDRSRRSFSSTMVGPVFSNLDPLAAGYTKAMSGEIPANEATQLMKRNAPFLNIFWIRGLMEHNLWNQVSESMSPGSIRRMERESEKSGQDYYWPPDEPFPKQWPWSE